MHFPTVALALSGFAAVSAMAAPAPVPAPQGVKHLQASRREIVQRKEIRERFGKRGTQGSSTPGNQCGQTGNFLLRTSYPDGTQADGQFLKLNNPGDVQGTAVVVSSGLDNNVAVWTLTQDCQLDLANHLGTGFTTYAANNPNNIFLGNMAGQIFTMAGEMEGITKPTCTVNGAALTCSIPGLGSDVSQWGVYSSSNAADALVLSNSEGFSTYHITPSTLYMVTVA